MKDDYWTRAISYAYHPTREHDEITVKIAQALKNYRFLFLTDHVSENRTPMCDRRKGILPQFKENGRKQTKLMK